MPSGSTPSSRSAAPGFVAKEVEIKGTIRSEEVLTISGQVEGEITVPGNLTIGENAVIRGEIKAKSVTVYGKVHGNITVDERCELKARAVLHGDLKAARLVIEEGATILPGQVARRPAGGSSRHLPGLLTKENATAAIEKYIDTHPEADRITVSIEGHKVVVKAAKDARPAKGKRKGRVAPDGYFKPFYTPELTAEDNRLAAHSILADAADFRG